MTTVLQLLAKAYLLRRLNLCLWRTLTDLFHRRRGSSLIMRSPSTCRATCMRATVRNLQPLRLQNHTYLAHMHLVAPFRNQVLYNFLALCVEYMGGATAADDHFRRQAPLSHTFPCAYLGYHTMPYFLDTCRFFILQYALVKPTLSVLVLVLHAQGECAETSQ